MFPKPFEIAHFANEIQKPDYMEEYKDKIQKLMS